MEAELSAELDNIARLETDSQGLNASLCTAMEKISEARTRASTMMDRCAAQGQEVKRLEAMAQIVFAIIDAHEHEDLCVICCDRPSLRSSQRVFAPCGHGRACEVCAKELQRRNQRC